MDEEKKHTTSEETECEETDCEECSCEGETKCADECQENEEVDAETEPEE